MTNNSMSSRVGWGVFGEEAERNCRRIGDKEGIRLSSFKRARTRRETRYCTPHGYQADKATGQTDGMATFFLGSRRTPHGRCGKSRVASVGGRLDMASSALD